MPAKRKRPPDAIERLYVYWIVSVVLLLFVLVVSTVYTRGALYRQAVDFNRSLQERDERIAALEDTVNRLHGIKPPEATTTVTQPPVSPPESEPSEPTPTPKPITPVPPRQETGPSAPATAAVPVEAEILGYLDQALVTDGIIPYVIDDSDAARAVLKLGTLNATRADWSAETWARLAVLARLMSQGTAADTFARRADQAGDSLIEYADVSARMLLTKGAAPDALIFAEHYVECTAGAPAAKLLLARVYLALENPASADALLATIADPGRLSVPERLALARAYYVLQHWEHSVNTLATVPAVPPELDAEWNFLQAVGLIQQNERLIEALGILDYLADNEQPAPPGDESLPPALSIPIPDDYEIATWRGVALMRGNQIESARRTFDSAARMRADRPDAHYWRAMLEIRENRPDAANDYLQNALATSARCAPAWEALGQLALNANNLAAAMDNLDKAIEINPRRATAHFLLALAYAKASQAEPTAQALTSALQLDPKLLATAQQTEVLARLFTATQMEEMAAPAQEPVEDNGAPR
ncbi:MAG: tetratricopeptide repeat protein [Planctomycetota bacterium]